MTMAIRPNSNKEKYDMIMKKVEENDGYCPCKLIKNQDTKCICKEFTEQENEGYCHCGAYYKEVKHE